MEIYHYDFSDNSANFASEKPLNAFDMKRHSTSYFAIIFTALYTLCSCSNSSNDRHPDSQLIEIADGGNATAQYKVAEAYLALAEEYYRMAADNDYEPAKVRLQTSFHEPKDKCYEDSTIIKQVTSDAENGDTYSQVTLGDMYYYGDSVTQDYDTAMLWYERAASHGSAEACNKLGLCLYLGLGSHKSQQDAAYWFEKGAQLGHADACYNYAVCLQKGVGTSQNKRAAISYLKKAAELGHLRAKKMLKDQ